MPTNWETLKPSRDQYAELLRRDFKPASTELYDGTRNDDVRSDALQNIPRLPNSGAPANNIA